ncbi:MAG TPA: hypothetical protein VNH17_08670, partial [Streptosporangiaceae bacterium]|nr:hypothetical protein [Streptosporangiaceae bacterium]
MRGGLLHQLLPVARLGVLQRFGSGTELMSWISLSDEIAAIRFLLDHGDVSGPVNLTAPDPVINSAFAAALDHMLHRPAHCRREIEQNRIQLKIDGLKEAAGLWSWSFGRKSAFRSRVA